MLGPATAMLDPATVQILFADLQPPIVARSKTNPPQSLSCAASVLARCACLLGLPVHHSVVPEGGKIRRRGRRSAPSSGRSW